MMSGSLRTPFGSAFVRRPRSEGVLNISATPMAPEIERILTLQALMALIKAVTETSVRAPQDR